MKNLYKILLLSTCATTILGASTAELTEIPRFYTSIETHKWNPGTIVINVGGEKINLSEGYTQESLSAHALRLSFLRISSGGHALQTHPQDLVNLTVALLSLQDRAAPKTVAPLGRQIHAIIDQYVNLENLSFDQKIHLAHIFLQQDQRLVGIEKLKAILTDLILHPADAPQRTATQHLADMALPIAIALGTPKEPSAEDDTCFLNAVYLYRQNAQLGCKASLDRLNGLLLDESCIASPSKKASAGFVGGAATGGTVRRINPVTLHRDIGLAILRNPTNGSMAEALDHLGRAYTDLDHRLESALTTPSTLERDSENEQMLLNLLARGHVPSMRSFDEKYDQALKAGNTALLSAYQTIALRFIHTLKVNGKDPLRNYLVKSIVQKTLDSFNEQESLAPGARLPMAQYQKFALSFLGTLSLSHPLIQSIAEKTRRNLSSSATFGTDLEWLGDIFRAADVKSGAINQYGLAYVSAGNTSALSKLYALGDDGRRIYDILHVLHSHNTFKWQKASAEGNLILSKALQERLANVYGADAEGNPLPEDAPISRLGEFFAAQLPTIAASAGNAYAQLDALKRIMFWEDESTINSLYKQAGNVGYMGTAQTPVLLTDAQRTNLLAKIVESAGNALETISRQTEPLEAKRKSDPVYAEQIKRDAQILSQFFKPRHAAAISAAVGFDPMKLPVLPDGIFELAQEASEIPSIPPAA